jgi:hypothetical protein
MSKYNNANPDHYKTAGRDPQGQTNRQHLVKQEFGETRAQTKSGKKKKPAPRAGPPTP